MSDHTLVEAPEPQGTAGDDATSPPAHRAPGRPSTTVEDAAEQHEAAHLAPGSSTDETIAADANDSAPDPKRWAALAVLALAQLMIVLDASIMNIALPSAGRALEISPSNLQWAITAYTLAFGGLLLLGGRIADYVGRKRTFIIGLAGFAIASAIGGAAANQGMLFGARALQGAFAALLAPASLSIITTTFTESKERAKAFGVFGAIAGGGAAIGLLLGGVLTEYLGWRWCLFVNLPIAIIAGVLAIGLVRESKAHGNTRLDFPGAILSVVGLVSLVYACTEAAKQVTNADGTVTTVGWGDPLVIGLLVVAVVALVSFVVLERRIENPLLPMRVVMNRNRGGSYLIFLLVGAGLFTMFLFMTLYLQNVMGYSALRTGFAMLPFSFGIIAMAGVVAQLLPRVGPKPLMIVGLTLAATGMFLLLRTTPDSSYVSSVLPAYLVMSVGMSMVFIPASSTALVGVGSHDAGVASALLNTSQQVGGSIGLALLNTISFSAITSKTTELVAAGGSPKDPSLLAEAQVHGFHVAYFGGALLIVLALVFAITLISAKKDDLPTEGAVAAA